MTEDPLSHEISNADQPFRRRLKRHILGHSLSDADIGEHRLSVRWGLPILSSDAMSSVAYACEEILLVFVPVLGMAAFSPLLGVAALILALTFILILAYRQTIDLYPEGGGAYSVARENFGYIPSLIAGSALMVGYVMTVTVSATAGTAAAVSAWPQLIPYQVPVTIVFIAFLTVGNLRGVRESSVFFGLPTYFFIISMVVMIVVGLVKASSGGVPLPLQSTLAAPAQDLTVFLFLRAFASGCSALTGVEAISNSVPNFAPPAQKRAKRTLVLLGLAILVIFGGCSVLLALYHVAPLANVTVIAQLATAVFGSQTAMFYIIQVTTALILLLAVNTALNGMPQLMSLMSAHNFLPHIFATKGSRLVYSNGIIFVAIISILLVIIYDADTHSLIPLYAIGVFLSFTIAQLGMLKHWVSEKGQAWQRKAIVNGIGSAVTATVTLVIGITKFTQGAWMSLVMIALLVMFMLAIHRHYVRVRSDLAIGPAEFHRRIRTRTAQGHIIIPVQSLTRSFLKALNYALGMGGDIELLHISTSPQRTHALEAQLAKVKLQLPLVVIKTSYRNVNEKLLEYIDRKHEALREGESLTVVMPQLVVQHWWQYMLHNQTSLALEASLLGRRNLAVVLVPFIARPEGPDQDRRTKKSAANQPKLPPESQKKLAAQAILPPTILQSGGEDNQGLESKH